MSETRKRALPPLPKRLDSNGKRPCRGCGGEVPKGRQTWCSNPCRETHYMALSTWARRRVEQRDRGVCARCGGDSEKVERIFSWLRVKGEFDAVRALAVAWGKPVSSYGVWVGHLWEADHVIPLAEGGTHDLSNYRTLCIPCHKEVTRQLRRRLSKAGTQQEIGGVA